MVLFGLVPSAAILATILLLAHTGVTLARSVGLESEEFLNSFNKRNSWWSKKSDFTPSMSDPSIDIRGLEDKPDSDTKLYGCYVSTCVPEFIGCATRSRTTSKFDTCKTEHRACAMRCWEMANDDSSM